MKKWFERLKEALCGILPLFILFGIPTVVAIVLWAIWNWDDIPVILSRISVIGNGSLIYGVILTLFGLIGLVNAFAAFIMWFKAFTEWMEKLDRKKKPRFLLWIIVIVVTFGWYALFELIKLL